MFDENQKMNQPEKLAEKQDKVPESQILPETPMKSAPQPVAKPSDDKAQAQQLSQTIQNSQPVQNQPVNNPGIKPQSAQPGSVRRDEPYIQAAEQVIDRDKEDPYREEEDHEDVQIKYLHDRFGKDIKKG